MVLRGLYRQLTQLFIIQDEIITNCLNNLNEFKLFSITVLLMPLNQQIPS